jgi:hypothetical protein
MRPNQLSYKPLKQGLLYLNEKLLSNA